MNHYSKTIVLVLLLLAVASLSPVVLATVVIEDFGRWPEDWPKELEPLRKEARTISNHQNIYEIRFNDRTVFERFWPVLSQLKSKGAPLTLYTIESPSPWDLLSNKLPAVRIYAPPRGSAKEPRSGTILEFGPPWPSSALLPDGRLPEYVRAETVDGKMTLVPAIPQKAGEVVRRFGEQRARVDIELVVDGKVIDLNRIPLPADTPIIDKRWPSNTEKSQAAK